MNQLIFRDSSGVLYEISISCIIIGNGAPSTMTTCGTNLFYVDDSTGEIYRCLYNTTNGYSWELIYCSNDTQQSIRATICASSNTGGKSAYQYAKEGGYTGTEKEFSVALGQIDHTLHMTLLWTNTDRAADFTHQTVSVDLSSYDAACILAGRQNGQLGLLNTLAPIGEVALLVDGSKHRSCEVNTNGVAFTDAYDGINLDNSLLIPYKVYGISGISDSISDITVVEAICGEFLCGEVFCGQQGG